MASYAVTEATHQTLTGTTADVITFAIGWQVVRVVNTDASDTVYFNVNTTTAPAAAAADTHLVRAGEAVVFASKAPIKVVNIVGDGGTYSIEGFPGFGSSASSAGGGGSSVTSTESQVIADDAAFTPATSKVFMAGFEADETATDSVDEGDAGAGRMTLDRKQIVNPQPHTAGGLTTFMASAADSSTALTNGAQAAKASAGQLYGYYIYNPNAVASFVQFYDVAQGSVTVGTTAPMVMLTIPATSAANLALTHGVVFGTAISVAATSTAGGNGAPTTALDAVFWYK